MTLERRPSGRRQADADLDARHAAQLRALNLDRVLRFAMSRAAAFTRTEVIEATGLSAPTVGTLCSHLIRSGILSDLGAGPSRGGRRPSFMEFNARHAYVAGIDIGVTKTRLALADLRGERVADCVVHTPAARAPADTVSRIGAELKTLMRAARVAASRLIAVGAGAPGVVDRALGVVVALAPNLKGWSDVPMANILQRALGAPVVVDNDVNLAVLGEHWRGAARGHDSCAFISVGNGIGAGIMINGEVHHGRHFLAGEIALMCMGPQYVDAEYGARGCLETLAGAKAIAARWAQAGHDGTEGGIRPLVDAAAAGDESARRIVDDTATLIGMATAKLSVVLDPSLIVLGGTVFSQAPEIAEDVRRIVAHIVPTPSPIVVSTLDREASLWGALLVATREGRARLRRQLRQQTT